MYYYIYVWYALMGLSLISDVILNIRYEKYKKDNGYKNKYKGAYIFKPLREGHIIKFLAKTIARYVVIGYCFEPVIELALFKGEAKKRLHEEEDEGSIEYVDPNIIDVEMQFVGETEGSMQEYEEMKAYSEQREREIEAEKLRKAEESLNNLFMDLMGVSEEEYERKKVIIDEEVQEFTSDEEAKTGENANSWGLHLKSSIKTSNDK